MADYMHFVEINSDSPVAICGKFVQICTDEWYRVTCPDCNEHRPKFAKGDRVHWTVTSMGRGTLSMKLREGVIEQIDDEKQVALVVLPKRSKNGRQPKFWVKLSRLRHMDERSQIAEFVDAVRDAVLNETENEQ